MKCKKSINARDFIRSHNKSLTISHNSPVNQLSPNQPKPTSMMVEGHHQFLSKIYGVAHKPIITRYSPLTRQHISIEQTIQSPRDEHDSSPFIASWGDRDIVDRDQQQKNKSTMTGRKKSQKKQTKAILYKQLKKKGQKKQKTHFQSAKMTSFLTSFSKTKIFDTQDPTGNKTKKGEHIFNPSKSFLQKSQQKMSPYELALRKKALKLIMLKINSLGTMADESEKVCCIKLQEELKSARQHKSKSNSRADRIPSLNSQQKKHPTHHGILWQKYARQHKKSLPSSPPHQDNNLPRLEATSLFSSSLKKHKIQSKKQITY